MVYSIPFVSSEVETPGAACLDFRRRRKFTLSEVEWARHERGLGLG